MNFDTISRYANVKINIFALLEKASQAALGIRCVHDEPGRPYFFCYVERFTVVQILASKLDDGANT